MIPEQHFVFRAALSRVIDGDTLDVQIDQGMHTYRVERLRLLGLNAPEMHGDSAIAGAVAKDYVIRWLDGVAAQLTVQTFKSDSFGRYLTILWRPDGSCLNDDLLVSGNAVVDVR